MNETNNQAIIIGGGIGGLTAAIALQKAGIAVKVYEQAATIKEVGAGLSLWTNAVKALYKLGLKEDLAKLSIPEVTGGIVTPGGELLSVINSRELEEKFGAPNLLVHRGELLELLRSKLPPAVIQTRARLTSFEQDSTGVTARFENGQVARGAFLVGADGIHSVVREQLFGTGKKCYSGYTAWRGITSAPPDMKLGGETWGEGARFGIVPLSGQRVYWFASANRPEGQNDVPAGRKQELLDLFDGWHTPIAEIINSTPEKAILRNDIYDRPPLEHWTMGRVTLLGDAAHPMTPNLGQGACQAIEDAVVLARLLSKAGNIPETLKAYEAARLKRANHIVKLSRQLGWVGQWQNPLACRLRNTLMRLIPSKWQLNQLAPIIGYEV
ncbi:MAG TPA: FAD-dependent monooxygenase [Chloroflexia bacterium]|nr:FAD-dependent monooxygenase [Chloroflexia bacterium]